MIIIYAAKHFTARVAGSVIKRIKCENCETEYFYQLVRAAQGKRTAHYFIGQKDAQQGAAAAAHESLQKRLNSDSELVPCPTCDHIQERDIAEFNKPRLANFLGPIATTYFIGLLVGVVVLVLYVSQSNRVQSQFRPWLIAFGAFFLLSPTWVVVYRYCLKKAYGSRRSGSTVRQLPPCTPLALLPYVDPASQKAILKPVPRRAEQRETKANPIYFDARGLSLAPYCCRCLKPVSDPAETFPRRKSFEVGLCVPFCRRCRRIRVLRLSLAYAAIAFICAAGTYATMELHKQDSIGELARNITVVAWGATCLLGGVGVNYKLFRPFFLAVADDRRSIFRFESVNQQYNRDVAELMRVGAETTTFQCPESR